MVQRVMAHSSKTAERAYMRSNLKKLGSKALHIIERVTAEHDKKKQEGPKAAATSTSRTTASVETAAAPKPTTSTEQEQGPVCEEVVQPSNTADTASTSTYSVSLLSSAVVPLTPERGLTDKQKAAIPKVFSKEITAGRKVSTETAQNRCCTSAVLATLASSRKRVKQVVNHVNYIIESNPRSPATKDPGPSTSKVHGW